MSSRRPADCLSYCVDSLLDNPEQDGTKVGEDGPEEHAPRVIAQVSTSVINNLRCLMNPQFSRTKDFPPVVRAAPDVGLLHKFNFR